MGLHFRNDLVVALPYDNGMFGMRQLAGRKFYINYSTPYGHHNTYCRRWICIT
jgi:hypothetical protein